MTDGVDWNHLRSASGGPGRIVAELLQAFVDGDLSVYDELFEQVCHQFSNGSASFAATIVLARELPRLTSESQIQALRIVGAVEASRLIHLSLGQEPKPEIEEQYRRALQDSLRSAASALTKSDLSRDDSFTLLAMIAALQGHPNVAMHLFLCPDSDSLSCPECGEYIRFGDLQGDGIRDTR